MKYEDHVVSQEPEENTSERKNKRKHESDISLERNCIVCYTNDYNIAVFPCGHLALCSGCWSNFKKSSKRVRCPMCRKLVKRSHKIYLA